MELYCYRGWMLTIKDLFPQKYKSILFALRDAAYFSSIADIYQQTIAFQKSLLRNKGPLEKVCGYRSTIKILFCPFIKLNNG